MNHSGRQWIVRFFLAGLLLSASLPAVQAAKVGSLRGGVTPQRARVVMDLDDIPDGITYVYGIGR